MKTNKQNNIQDSPQNDLIEVGKLGRTIGFSGAFVFHSSSDFLSFLQPKTQLFLQQPKETLTIKYFEHTPIKNTIAFDEITSKEQAQQYVNALVFTTKEQTRTLCKLQEGEFFYFDIIGCQILENNDVLGEVIEIERIGEIDYFTIQYYDKTRQKIRTFMLPYIDKYVTQIDIHQKIITTTSAKDIQEQS